MRFSIVTPTIVRSTLERQCEWIDKQDFPDYEHILLVDGPLDTEKLERLEELRTDKRVIVRIPGERHNNYGNTPRHLGSRFYCRGEYVLYQDDDVYFSRPDALSILHDALNTADSPCWAVYSINYMGRPFLNFPPGNGLTDINQVIHKQFFNGISGAEIFFPNNDAINTDGVFAEQLRRDFPDGVALPTEPLVMYEKMNYGAEHI